MTVFPEPVQKLPKADIPIKGINAFLSQSDNHQVIFMEFNENVDLPKHSHKAQWGVVLERKINLKINGVKKTFFKGDRYFIPEDVIHLGRIYAGYSDITFFNEKDRYSFKQSKGN